MKLEIEDLETRYRLLPSQILATETGAIVRRGTTQMRVSGDGAFAIVERAAQLASRPGGATVDEICDSFALDAREPVRGLVQGMIDRRFLVEALVPDAPPSGAQRTEDALDVFFWQSKLDADETRSRLTARQVAIVGVNAISARLAPALRSLGYASVTVLDHPMLRGAGAADSSATDYEEWVARGEEVDTLIATSDFGGLSAMRDWNLNCIDRGVTFIPVVLQDLIGYVGPVVVPRETPCFECFFARQNSHLEEASRARESEVGAFYGQAVDARLAPMAGILGDIAALELFKLDAGVGGVPNPVGRIVEVALLEPSLTTRRLLKIPRCRACGPLALAAARSTERDVFMPGNE